MTSLLDRAVDTVESWGGERDGDRARCIELLEQAAGQMRRAIAVWSAFLDNAPESGDRFTAVLWMGAEPAKQLQAIYLDNRQTAVALTELTGVRFKDSLSLAEDLDIVQPYDQLGTGETGGERAQAAIRSMSTRMQSIESAIASLRK